MIRKLRMRVREREIIRLFLLVTPAISDLLRQHSNGCLLRASRELHAIRSSSVNHIGECARIRIAFGRLHHEGRVEARTFQVGKSKRPIMIAFRSCCSTCNCGIGTGGDACGLPITCERILLMRACALASWAETAVTQCVAIFSKIAACESSKPASLAIGFRTRDRFCSPARGCAAMFLKITTWRKTRQ
jgi:hypothetical protein